MNSQIKKCQNCKQDFTIEPEDFDFYNKIKVPPPTFCPSCSHQRRFAWRNTHAFYHRPNGVTGDDVISIYHPDVAMNVVDQKYWWSDAWDPFDYGMDFDFSRDFFSQWRDIRNKIPFQALSNSKAVNSDYCNVAEESYDCYLISASWKSERIMYSDSIHITKDCLDLYVVLRSEFCYDDIFCADSYKLFYSQDAYSCIDSYFLYDCRGCTDCFMSTNLRNKSYVFRNQQLSKEAYQEKIKSIDVSSYSVIQDLKKEFHSMEQNAIHRFAQILNSYNSTGDNIEYAKNCKNCFNVTDGLEECKNLFWGGMKAKEVYNSGPGVGAGELMYEVLDTGIGAFRNLFTNVVYEGLNIEYSFNCYSCKDCFGCIGLRNKSYCILNKQYTKEEYFDMVEKIKQHMMDMPYVDKKGRVYRYGEFFPIELSPFAYNETVANNFYPLTKEEILEKGFQYREKEIKNYIPTLTKENIPDNIKDVSDTITSEIIACDTLLGSDRCATAFKITDAELLFYRRLNIPLPRQCYQCRHKARFQKRTPLRLWTRTCMNQNSPEYANGPCQNTFETSYAPEKREKVYCEACYKREVL